PHADPGVPRIQEVPPVTVLRGELGQEGVVDLLELGRIEARLLLHSPLRAVGQAGGVLPLEEVPAGLRLALLRHRSIRPPMGSEAVGRHVPRVSLPGARRFVVPAELGQPFRGAVAVDELEDEALRLLRAQAGRARRLFRAPGGTARQNDGPHEGPAPPPPPSPTAPFAPPPLAFALVPAPVAPPG